MPEDWDEEMDGEWEPPMVDNPEYKGTDFTTHTVSNRFPTGEWKPKNIKNPAYKGKWVHPEIDNPEYASDDSIYSYDDFGRVGLDLWQV